MKPLGISAAALVYAVCGILGTPAVAADPHPVPPKTLSDFSNQLGSDWLYAEQVLPSKTPFLSNIRNPIGLVSSDASHNGKLPAQYHPESRGVFPAGTLLVPYEKAVVVGESVPDDLVTTVDDRKYVTFFYHPSQKKYYASTKFRPGSEKFFVTPSSSARSLFVLGEKFESFVAKTSLNDSVMGGFDRKITLDEAIRSVYNSNRLKELHRRVDGRLPDSKMKWDFFEESAAVFAGDSEKGGFIFRKIPKSLNPSTTTLLPMYSLIAGSKGPRTSRGSNWIERLFADSGYSSKADFVFDRIVKPMTELFSQLGFDAGITAQMHQQNLLLGIKRVSGKYRITGLYLRDTEALFPILSIQTYLDRKAPPPDELLNSTAASRRLKGALDAEKDIFMYRISASKFLQGYSEDMRYNSVRSIFKYFLSPQELDDVTIRMDRYFTKKAAAALPEKFAPKRISELREKFFAFDEEVLKTSGRADVLAERRIVNSNTDYFVRGYETWVNDLLNYRNRPSEKTNLCAFMLKRLPRGVIKALGISK